jgi:hypothetical protein
VLGLRADLTAVEALLDIGRRILVDPALRHAAQQAVARIQSRLGDVEAGRLSLAASSDAGALSLSDAGPGGLSLAQMPEPDPPE